MRNDDGSYPKYVVKFSGYLAVVVVLTSCVQIVGMDDPTLVDRLDEPSSSAGAGGKGSSSTTSASGSPGVTSSSDSSAGGPSTSSSSSGGSGGVASIWADWPMPNPPNGALPNPAVYAADSASGVVKDLVTKLLWQGVVQGGGMAQPEAKAYCEGLDFAGFSDWRLPSRIELVSLVDFTKSAPAIDTTAFPETPATMFWTSSPVISLAKNEFWTVDFNSGATSSADAGTPYQVRCVR